MLQADLESLTEQLALKKARTGDVQESRRLGPATMCKRYVHLRFRGRSLINGVLTPFDK